MARVTDKRSGRGKPQAPASDDGAVGAIRPSQTFDFGAWNAPEFSEKFVSRRDLRRFWLIMWQVEMARARERRWHRRLWSWWVGAWREWTTRGAGTADGLGL